MTFGEFLKSRVGFSMRVIFQYLISPKGSLKMRKMIIHISIAIVLLSGIVFAEKTGGKLNRRFNNNGDGTVTDLKTGLMWTKNANLPGDTLTFREAVDYVAGMNEGNRANFGYTDWRLPYLSELQSLIDYTRYKRQAHMLPLRHPFRNVQSLGFNDRSSATYLTNNDFFWFLSLYCGLVGHNVESCYGYVWPVRGGR